jgi:hypothetical protein
MIVSALILGFASNKPTNFTNYLSLFIIATLGFIAPLFALIVAVPIFVIVYINNQDSLKGLWAKASKITVS